jgi:copper transporter 1
MLFTWNTKNLCIVFRQWHVRSTFDLILSLVAVVIIGMGYEALRAASRRYEMTVTKRVEAAPSKPFPGPVLVSDTLIYPFPFLYSSCY